MSQVIFSCRVIQNIWMKCYFLLGICTVLPNNNRQHFWQDALGLNGGWVQS